MGVAETTVTNQTAPLGSKIVQDLAATNAAVSDTTGAAGTLYMVEIDNSGYSSAVYFKLVNADSATVGTTVPTMVHYCPASSKRSYVFPEGIVFSVGFTHWCVTGASEGSSAAPGTVKVRYVTT